MKLMLGKATSFWLKKKILWYNIPLVGLEVIVYRPIQRWFVRSLAAWRWRIWELDGDFDTLATGTVP